MGFTLDLQIVRDSRGDLNVRELLIETIWPEAFRVALGIIGDRGLAEDTAQEACASIAIELPKLRSDEAFYAWMYRIIVRHATAAARRSERTAPASAADTSVPFPSVDVRLDVIAALAALPVTQRSAVVLHYYAGYTSVAIASVLKVPASTVRFHLMLARRALKASLADTPLRPGGASKETSCTT